MKSRKKRKNLQQTVESNPKYCDVSNWETIQSLFCNSCFIVLLKCIISVTKLQTNITGKNKVPYAIVNECDEREISAMVTSFI